MSLAEKLAQLANPVPVFQDPEDVQDETAAKLIEQHEGDDVVVGTGTALRRKAAPLLEEEDVRYAGKAVSRKALTDFDIDDHQSSESDDGDDNGQGSSSSVENPDEEDGDESGEEEVDEEEEEEEISDVAEDPNEGSGEEGEDESSGDDGSDGDATGSGESEADDDLEAFKRKLQQKVGKMANGKREEKEETEEGDTTFTSTHDGDFSQYADDFENEAESDGSDDSGSGSDESDDGDQGDSESEMEVEDGGDDSESEMEVEEGGDDSALLGLSEQTEEVAKGRAATNQLELWDSLLEARIRLQKAVQLVNQLPQPDAAPAFMSAGGQPLNHALKAGNSAFKQLLEKLVELQSLLYLQYPQTQYVMTGAQPGAKKANDVSDGSDEEITSEEEDGGTSGNKDKPRGRSTSGQVAKAEIEAKRKRKLKEYPELVAKRHKAFASFRDATIEKWHDKTRVSSSKVSKGFSAFEQPTLKQIQQVLRDRTRLIERTRVKRNALTVLGKTQNKSEQAKDKDVQDEEQPELRGNKEEDEDAYDAEIFDDSDFYHRLLRELIERKTQGVSDPIAVSRQWIQMQSLRQRNKRRVDPRASKGRKIRYDIHPKLVNLMAPVDACQWLDQARDELFSSLFGQMKKQEAATPKG